MPPPRRRNRSVRLARMYAGANRRFEQGQRLVDAVFHGAWLGVLDREALAAVDAAFYATRREPVEGETLPYADPAHIRSGLHDWEASALQARFPPGGRLVITSAGAGREVLGAFALGFDAVGFEPHAALREAGEAVLAADGHAGALRACERDAFPAEAGACDGVVVGWGGYSHIQGRARRLAFLRGARDVVREGAPLLVSYWMLPGRPRYLRTAYATARMFRRLTRREPVEPGDLLLPVFVHCFSEAEIRAECEAAGFGDVECRIAPYPHAIAHAV